MHNLEVGEPCFYCSSCLQTKYDTHCVERWWKRAMQVKSWVCLLNVHVLHALVSYPSSRWATESLGTKLVLPCTHSASDEAMPKNRDGYLTRSLSCKQVRVQKLNCEEPNQVAYKKTKQCSVCVWHGTLQGEVSMGKDVMCDAYNL